jgi:hypothetical protein
LGILREMNVMRYMIITIWFGIWIVSLCFGVQVVSAEGEGFLSPPADSSSIQNMLPPGAVLEGTQVLHKISTTKENLHLLAGYYYGNPRLWRKIYDDNRNIIKNPNRLPVGETIRINVGEGWKPRFSYQEWFNLATRNGEWKPGHPWQRTSPVSAPTPTPAAGPREVPPSGEQNVAPVPQETPKAEASKTPTPTGTPAKEAPAKETPTEEKPAEPAF